MKPSRVVVNAHVDRSKVRPMETAPAAFHETLPGFAPTSLRPAPECAKALGVRSVHVKDESMRVGMPAFKILGASWATYRVMMRHFGKEPSANPSLQELRELVTQSGQDLTLVAATDGNHGRAVARMAKLLGLNSIICVPQSMVESRKKAIARNGAEVRVVAGDYDLAIKESAALADATHIVVSDTSWEGYTEPPKWVIDGYSTMLGEVISRIEAGHAPEPSVVLAQMGVGAFSAAVAAAFAPRPARMLVGVEPVTADCVTASVENGDMVQLDELPGTSMAGLDCGTPSLTAWPDNLYGFDRYATVTDEDAEEATRLLYRDYINAGESGAAGLAALLAHGAELGLKPDDDVLVFLTEGVTDPVNFARIIGEDNPLA